MTRIEGIPTWPARPSDGHKGSFGHALIIGGSRGMSGAAALAGLAALRGGAGLVTLAVGVSVLPIVAAIEPSYITVGLPEDADGRLSVEALTVINQQISRVDAVAIGPGLGQSPMLRQLVFNMYQTCPLPLVLDADALNMLATLRDWPRPVAVRVLTPHPGEFSRLTGHSTATIATHREELAAEFARRRGVTVLLKGAGTVVTDGERISVNTTGNAGMATGGSGDVLTGLLASLLAQQARGIKDAFQAARLAAHLHGLAGDLAAQDLSEPGLIASDLPRYLALAWTAWRNSVG